MGKLAYHCTQKNVQEKFNRVLTNSAEIANQDKLAGYYIIEEGDYVYNPLGTLDWETSINDNSINAAKLPDDSLYEIYEPLYDGSNKYFDNKDKFKESYYNGWTDNGKKKPGNI